VIKGYLLLFSGMALVGTYVALSKPLTAAIPVFLLATLRFAIAAVFMLGWLRHGPSLTAVPQAGLKQTLFLQSLFGNFLFSICMLWGVSLTSAAAAGVILASLPAVIALMSWLWLKERLTAKTLGAIGFAVLGVALLSLGKPQPSAAKTSVPGNLLVLGCVICEAVYVILGKRLTAYLSPQKISAVINLIGLALMLPFGLWQAASFDFYSVGGSVWLLLIFYALAASMISTWLWLSGLNYVPASRSGVFTIALPLSASLVAVGFLGESFTALHWLAFISACGGLLLATWPDR
jgi:drug/metabolite transporter (DMT)-like permease